MMLASAAIAVDLPGGVKPPTDLPKIPDAKIPGIPGLPDTSKIPGLGGLN